MSTVLESRVLFPSSNPESYLQCFRLQVVLNMDTQSNPRRALKSAQEQKDRRHRRNERDRAWRATETAEQRSKRLTKRRERDRARRAAQLLVKRKLPHSRKVPVNAKEWQLKPRGERNEVTANTFIGCKLHCCILTSHTILTKLFIHAVNFYKHNLVKQHDHSCNMKNVQSTHIYASGPESQRLNVGISITNTGSYIHSTIWSCNVNIRSRSPHNAMHSPSNNIWKSTVQHASVGLAQVRPN